MYSKMGSKLEIYLIIKHHEEKFIAIGIAPVSHGKQCSDNHRYLGDERS